MVQQIKGLLYYYTIDLKRALIIFWTILIASSLLSFFIRYFIGDATDTKIFFTSSIAIYIFTSIYSFSSVKTKIPYMLKIGATRKNIFISTGAFFLIVAIAQAVFERIFEFVIGILIRVLDVTSYNFAHPGQLINDAWITKMTVDIVMIFSLFVIFFIGGLILYKYGLIGIGGVAGTIVVFILSATSKGWLLDFIRYLDKALSLTLFGQLFAISLLIYICSWLFIRRISTIHVQ